MDTQQIEQVLRESLEDRRLSRKERKDMRAFVAGERDEEAVRRLAFGIASTELTAHPDQSQPILEWLESVSKAVTHRAVSKAELAEVFFSPGEHCRSRIARAIGEARTSADICVFTITDDRLVDALMSAKKRGVAIRIAADNDKAHDRGSDIRRLEQEGFDVRVDQSPHHMHHKFALFDRELLLNGSYNWTRSAFKHNRENLLATTSPALVSRFVTAFDEMWAAFGE